MHTLHVAKSIVSSNFTAGIWRAVWIVSGHDGWIADQDLSHKGKCIAVVYADADGTPIIERRLKIDQAS